MGNTRTIQTLENADLLRLEKLARTIRVDIIEMLSASGSGHAGGSLGVADIMTVLYFHVLVHDPKKPMWSGRDRFLLSNGHVCPARYVAMAHAGYFSKKILGTLRQFKSPLQGHPERTFLPAVENTSGPLGDGAAQSVGLAYLAKTESLPWRTYCLLSDGELETGIVWESALFASKNSLDNLTWIIDRNGIQIDGNTEDIVPLEPLREKFESFGFEVIESDGHNIRDLSDACGLAASTRDRPTVIIAHTISGKGVRYMERDYRWHGAVPGTGPDDKVPKSKQKAHALIDLKTI
ncbi:MAG: transketolase [Patescibacteria group bacterium]|jgi:transketolase